MLRATALLRQPGHAALARIHGMGELLSSYLLHACLRERGGDYARLDAREVLRVRHGELGAIVDWDTSAARLAEWRQSHPQPRVVVTGFIASDADGQPTVLGRNGSDFSAAIFASLFDADEVHLWSDVDGVLSADPRLVPEAVSLPALSYREACELAYFGAKVIHPQTMTPAMVRGLPLLIRNTFNPGFAGTRIDAERWQRSRCRRPGEGADPERRAGPGQPGRRWPDRRAGHRRTRVRRPACRAHIGRHDFAGLVGTFDLLPWSVNPMPRRRTPCCWTRSRANWPAARCNGVQVVGGICVLAAVGDRMAGTPGVAAQLFGALARARVNIRAIAQGASERNISVAIAATDATRALRAAHAAFWLSPQTVALAVIGPGNVGGALLDQLQAALPRLRRDANLDLRLRALVTSSKTWQCEYRGAVDWRDRMQAEPIATDLSALGTHLLDTHLPHAVIVDCSASNAVAEHYPAWLAAGIHVITPNKQAGAGSLERYEAIRAGACAWRRAFPLRGHRRRRPAGDLHPARPARYRRRTDRHRRHPLGHAGVAVQQVRWQQAVLGTGPRGACAGLYRTRSAR